MHLCTKYDKIVRQALFAGSNYWLLYEPIYEKMVLVGYMKHKKKKNKNHSKHSHKSRSAKKASPLVEGKIKRTQRGFGWLDENSLELKNVFLPAFEIKGIFNGDTVLCSIEQKPKGPLGHVEKVLQRNTHKVLGNFIRKGAKAFVQPDEQTFSGWIEIAPEFRSETKDIAPNTLVEAEIVKQPYLAKISRVFGLNGDFSTEVEKIIIHSGIDVDFNDQVKNEAKKFGDNPGKNEAKGRLDLTKIALCTIDGETAKDFDDAVFAAKEGKDFKVVAAIADVANYVKQGSNLDTEAYERATSIYYPGNCIPMIPDSLSNGLCSLKPKVNRLCMAVEMVIGPKGAVKKVSINNAIMKSQARLTYTLMQNFIDKQDLPEVGAPVKKSLHVLIEVAKALRGARQRRGALDFDVAESFVELDDLGEPLSIHPENRLEAHRLIEDLMVATNEAVADFIKKHKRAGLYRVHENPNEDKLSLFLDFAQAVGCLKPAQKQAFDKIKSPKDLATIAAGLSKHESSLALNMLLLRSMQQARYAAEDIGHFGLASKGYLHFTSPIRRYPDLAVHRVVKSILASPKKELAKQKFEQDKENMQTIATHCSNKERKAVELERTLDALHGAWFMRKKVSVTDKGVVMGCTEFGLFVRLNTYHVEGLVHVAEIGQGFLEYDPLRMRLEGKQSHFSIGVGDEVNVRLVSVSIEKRHIDLELI